MENQELLKQPPKAEDLGPINEGRETFLAECKAIVITDASTYSRAGELLVEAVKRKKKVDDLFDPLIEANKKVKATAEAARKLVADTKDRVAAPFVEVEGILKAARLAYDREEAKKRAEAEAEAQRKAEEEALANAEASGDASLLDNVRAAPVAVELPKTEGVYNTRTWTYCASGDPLDEAYTKIDDFGFRVPDHAKIGGVVKALKADTKIRGVTPYERVDERVRVA
jgi:hypothetical protein